MKIRMKTRIKKLIEKPDERLLRRLKNICGKSCEREQFATFFPLVAMKNVVRYDHQS